MRVRVLSPLHAARGTRYREVLFPRAVICVIVARGVYEDDEVTMNDSRCGGNGRAEQAGQDSSRALSLLDVFQFRTRPWPLCVARVAELVVVWYRYRRVGFQRGTVLCRRVGCGGGYHYPNAQRRVCL